jgi:hypothetical protein
MTISHVPVDDTMFESHGGFDDFGIRKTQHIRINRGFT